MNIQLWLYEELFTMVLAKLKQDSIVYYSLFLVQFIIIYFKHLNQLQNKWNVFALHNVHTSHDKYLYFQAEHKGCKT